MFKNILVIGSWVASIVLAYQLGTSRAEVQYIEKKVEVVKYEKGKRAIFWLSQILATMTLAACSTTAGSETGCIEFPKGGPAMGGVYRRLSAEDRKIANEYFNRLYKVSQLPVFCKKNN